MSQRDSFILMHDSTIIGWNNNQLFIECDMNFQFDSDINRKGVKKKLKTKGSGIQNDINYLILRFFSIDFQQIEIINYRGIIISFYWHNGNNISK